MLFPPNDIEFSIPGPLGDTLQISANFGTSVIEVRMSSLTGSPNPLSQPLHMTFTDLNYRDDLDDANPSNDVPLLITGVTDFTQIGSPPGFTQKLPSGNAPTIEFTGTSMTLHFSPLTIPGNTTYWAFFQVSAAPPSAAVPEPGRLALVAGAAMAAAVRRARAGDTPPACALGTSNL